ncbi:MAG: reverse transcriptase domain-containing protein [Candidatus Tectimicrobiota bacterium]
MKRHGHLFEQVSAFDNLLLAVRQARRGKHHRPRVAHFDFHLETELCLLQDELRSGTYRMRPYHTFIVYEPKQRQICAADFRDRVVHHAICNVLDPLFDACLIHDTYACRRGKGTHAAVKRVQHFARRFPFALKGDIRQYFASVDHGVLKGLLRRKLKDQRLLTLLDQIIDHPLPGGVPGQGIPIGNLTSQYFANLYLGELDHFLKDRLRRKGYVRYMDDFLVLADDKPSLHATLAAIRIFLQDTLHLALKDEVVYIAPVSQGVPFVGFRIYPGMVKLARPQWVRFTRRVQAQETRYHGGLIDEETLARSVTSMIGHTLHADTLAARRHFFSRSLAFG